MEMETTTVPSLDTTIKCLSSRMDAANEKGASDHCEIRLLIGVY